MYEELVKRLRSHSGWALNKTLDEAADAIEELSNAGSIYGKAWTLGYDAGRDENMPHWISVTERLPKESWERVLAYTDDGTVMTLPAIKLRNGYVRYWMPLPEPPKEDDSE